MFIRTGWPTVSTSVSAGIAMPGLSIECAEWAHRSELAMIVTDCALDPAPSQVAGVLVPWHILALTRMGLRLVDPGNIVHAADTNGMIVITASIGSQIQLSSFTPKTPATY